MEIKNLSQLKKAVGAKTPFTIVEHFIRPENNGQVREPKTIQTNGFYSAIYGDPGHPISNANGGRGYWFDYGKASDWVFENGFCTKYDHRDGGNRRPVWTIKFAD